MLGIVSEYEAQSAVGNCHWNDIIKSILKSQPPRELDVPDMADYVKRYGGLPSGSFTKDLAELLKLHMPDDRIVSGNTFKSFASLKFSVDEIPTHLINAMLFRHASSESHVRDKIAGYISKPDITLIALKKIMRSRCTQMEF